MTLEKPQPTSSLMHTWARLDEQAISSLTSLTCPDANELVLIKGVAQRSCRTTRLSY
jgi:hypothetical protein